MSQADKDFSRQDASKFTKLIGDRDPIYKIAEATDKEKFLSYRKIWEDATRFETLVDFPIQIDFEVTNTCNLRCIMCPHGLPAQQRDEDYRVPKQILIEDYKKIIDEGVPRGLMSVNLNGINEPFLHPEILDFIRYAKDKGLLDIMLNTNATFVTPDKYDDILDSGLTRIMFSLDAATKETYEKVRRSNKFETIKNNILGFIKRKEERQLPIPVTRVSFVNTAANINELDEFIEFWSSKVDFLAVQELVSYEKNHDIAELQPTGGEIDTQTFKCPQPWQKAFIAADGSVRPCCTVFGKEFKLGNISDKTIEEIWHSPTYKTLRKIHKEGNWQVHPICKRCVENNSHQ